MMVGRLDSFEMAPFQGTCLFLGGEMEMKGGCKGAAKSQTWKFQRLTKYMRVIQKVLVSCRLQWPFFMQKWPSVRGIFSWLRMNGRFRIMTKSESCVGCGKSSFPKVKLRLGHVLVLVWLGFWWDSVLKPLGNTKSFRVPSKVTSFQTNFPVGLPSFFP